MPLVEDLDLRTKRTVTRPGALTQSARVRSILTQVGAYYSSASPEKQVEITRVTTDWVKSLMDIDQHEVLTKGPNSREVCRIKPASESSKPHPIVWYIRNGLTVNDARRGIIYNCKSLSGFLPQDALLMAVYWKEAYLRKIRGVKPLGKRRSVPQPLQEVTVKKETNSSLTGGRISVANAKAKPGEKQVPYFSYSLKEIRLACDKLKKLDKEIASYIELSADVPLKPVNLPVIGKKGAATLILAHLHRIEVETEEPVWDKMMIRGLLELVKVRSKAAEKFDALFGLALCRPKRIKSLVQNSEYADLDLNRSCDRTKMKNKLESELENTGDALKYTDAYKIFRKIYKGSSVSKM